MGSPTLITLEVKASLSHLWLRSIRGINLDAHCARSFVGPYSDAVGPQGLRAASPVRLEGDGARAFYLCGVTKPYVWADNFHCAFAYSRGALLDINERGVHLVVADAVRLAIPEPIARPHLAMGQRPEFYTCRNWQFAAWLHSQPIASSPEV